MHSTTRSEAGFPKEGPTSEDTRHARGIAYNGVLEWIQFNQQRRIGLAYNIGDSTVKGLAVWVSALALAKSVTINGAGAAVLQAIVDYLPLFGGFMCVVLMGIARSVYQDEVNYIVVALDYEADIGGYGTANARYKEIVFSSFWRPATTELAGIFWFMLWATVFFINQYYM